MFGWRRLPETGVAAFEERAVADVVNHLGLAAKILEAGAGAVLDGHRLHEALDFAVVGLVPVMIRPSVAERPTINGGHHRANGVGGWRIRQTEFSGET